MVLERWQNVWLHLMQIFERMPLRMIKNVGMKRDYEDKKNGILVNDGINDLHDMWTYIICTNSRQKYC